MITLKHIAVSLVFLSITACSTLFDHGAQRIMLTASNNQEGMRVQVNDPEVTYFATLPIMIATTPSSFSSLTVKVVDECYEPTLTKASSHVTPSYFMNLWNLYGFVIDWGTGRMWTYDTHLAVKAQKRSSCGDDTRRVITTAKDEPLHNPR